MHSPNTPKNKSPLSSLNIDWHAGLRPAAAAIALALTGAASIAGASPYPADGFAGVDESEVGAAASPVLPPPIAPGRLDTFLARTAATMEMRGPLAFPPAALPSDRQVALYARSVPGQRALMEAAIAELGGSFSSVGGDILAVRLPAAALPAFGRLESVERAEAALPARPLLDESVPEIGADRVTSGKGLLQALTGEGVILGLVDTGLDYTHPTFLGDDGLPRILAVWDQGAQGEPPVGHSIGRLCRREDIIDQSCPSLDIVGHGTHVAATAGGNDFSFPGVAPKVEFVSSGSLTFELMAEAAQWIFDTADEHGRPAVINMSLGGHYGAHDGSGLEEQALTAMSGPGRIVVVASGNDGGSRIHLSYALEEEPGRTDLLIYPGFMSDGGFVDLWNQAGGEMEIQLALVDSEGEIVGATGFRGSADPVFSGNVRDQDQTILGQAQISFEPPHADTGKVRATVFLIPGSDPNTFAGNPSGLRWVLEMKGSGTFHAWISSASFGSAPAAFGTGGRTGDDLTVVAMPGTAPGVLTVAAYSTRNSWSTVDGGRFEDESISVGDIAFFSSGGPSSDPARTGIKPEIAAPGEFIAAPFGRNAIIFDRSTMLDEDVAAMRGTSMATPHVAGAVALLLQASPELDREGALEILRTSARSDDFTGTVPNDRWGWGKLDAHAAALLLVGPPLGEEEQNGCGCSAGAGSNAGSLHLIICSLLLVLVSTRRRRKAGQPPMVKE